MTRRPNIVRRRRWATVAALLAASAPAGAASPAPYQPAMRGDFPDPFVLPHKGQFLAYATNPDRGRVNIQMASSPDLLNWAMLRDGGKLHDAMPTLPPWARPGFTWAPEVLRVGSLYVLYFTARDRISRLQCIGVAVSADPLGPFTSTASAPLTCQKNLGGSIDPDAFRDADGKLILYFKNDGNNPAFRKPTRIYAQQLTPDGLAMVGTPVPLLANEAPWEGNVVEAPSMVHHDGGYTLFFSANDYGWREPQQRLSRYAIGYARCRSAMGPCTAGPDNPILSSRMGIAGCLSGPGHQAVFEAEGRSFIAFHAWSASASCRPLDPIRNLYVARLSWTDGKPVIGPSVHAPMDLKK